MSEYDNSIAAVAVEQSSQQVQLCRGGQGQCALLAVGVEGLAALGRTKGEIEELAPAVGLAHVDARLLYEPPVDAREPARTRVRSSSLTATYSVATRYSARNCAQLADLAAKDKRPDELIGEGDGLVGEGDGLGRDRRRKKIP